MRTGKLKRPTLADLWRHLLEILEGLGAENAPALARSLAISGLMGQPAVAFAVRVERSGEVFTITSPRPSATRRTPEGRPGVRGTAVRLRRRLPVGC